MRGRPVEDPMARIALGAKLRTCRKTLALQQADVATALGISRTLVVAIEQGKAPVEANRLQQFATLYQQPVKHFQDVVAASANWGTHPLNPELLAVLTCLGPPEQHQVLRFAQFLSDNPPPGPTPDAGGEG